MHWGEILGGMGVGGVIMALGNVASKLWSNKRTANRDALVDYQGLFDLVKREREECLERLAESDRRHDECERQSYQLHGEIKALREEIYRDFLKSDPPPREK